MFFLWLLPACVTVVFVVVVKLLHCCFCSDSSPTPAAPLRNKRLDQDRFLHNRASKSMDLGEGHADLLPTPDGGPSRPSHVSYQYISLF